VRLASFPLTVLAVVAASYLLARQVTPAHHVAAPVVRTSSKPPLAFAPVGSVPRASYAPATQAAPARAPRAGLRPLQTPTAATAPAAGGAGTAVSFATDPWSVQTASFSATTGAPSAQAAAPVTTPAPVADTATTTAATETTTTTAPPPPPVEISDVRTLAMAPTSATLAWHTSEPVSSRIAYGTGAPTLWTAPAPPSTDHVAALTGLAYGTSYVLSVDTQAPDGRTSAARYVLTTPALPDTVVTGTSNGAFVVGGQPFFPTMVWDACSDSYSTQLAAGIDVFMGNGCGSASDQLQRLQGQALSLVDAGAGAVKGPGLAGSFLPDEWDLHLPGTLSSAEAARLSATAAPGPRFLTLTNHFYSRAEPLPQGRALYPALVANADVIGFDLYPLQSWCRWNSFGDVYDAQQELVRLAQGKPTFQWIEARAMDCAGDPALDPTPETVRAETWLAIAGGAHGIGYFPKDWSPDVGAEIAREKQEIESLVPALTASALPAGAEGDVVRVGARSLNGAVYVIAVNASRSPQTDTIVVPDLGDRSLVSLDGTRSVTAAGGRFTDTFAPLEVHVYVSAPTAL
jgi:hypothetical protein